MGQLVPIVLERDTDQVLAISILRADPADDLTVITELRMILKDSSCDLDIAATMTLSTVDPSQMKILTQAAGGLTAEAYIPASAVGQPYKRWYRVDAYAGAAHRPALYGPATITPL